LKLELATEQANPKTAVSFENRLAQITGSRPVLLASAEFNSEPSALNPSGFAMDYTLVQSGGPYTFQAGQTYLVNSQVYLSGATLYAGACIK
jgi:chitinase